ncbi:MAG: type II toxin-antitoxin system VapC family toxin [Verrucomicrobia bacterium]|nr:type II toxin-antitoxin system VapC family toxin [Verrucomicrobiota bacterium]
MIKRTAGLDTGFLVAYEAIDHPRHAHSEALVRQCLSNRADFALAPQVLVEFVHVLTDQKRFTRPLTMDAALQPARMWRTAAEVTQVFSTDAAVNTFVGWMKNYGLGRKRILDTLLSATYSIAGITSSMTTNIRDFRIFGVLSIVEP